MNRWNIASIKDKYILITRNQLNLFRGSLSILAQLSWAWYSSAPACFLFYHVCIFSSNSNILFESSENFFFFLFSIFAENMFLKWVSGSKLLKNLQLFNVFSLMAVTFWVVIFFQFKTRLYINHLNSDSKTYICHQFHAHSLLGNNWPFQVLYILFMCHWFHGSSIGN